MRDLVARLANEGFPRQVDLVAAGYLDELQRGSTGHVNIGI